MLRVCQVRPANSADCMKEKDAFGPQDISNLNQGAAAEWGRLVSMARQNGRVLSVLDSQIEATAIHFGLVVVTRNSADFYNPTLNPWKLE